MENNSLEQIMKDVFTNEEYLKSEKRCYRLIVSNLKKGLITICGEKNIGKRLFAINLVNNLEYYNDAEILFITNKSSKEELAIRIATCRTGVNPIHNQTIVGSEKFIKKNLIASKNIKIVNFRSIDFEDIKSFAQESKHKYKIVIFDNADSDELQLFKDIALGSDIIVIATVNYINYDYDFDIYNAIYKSSDVVVKIEKVLIDSKHIYANILKNKCKERDKIELKVNQFCQRIYETYESDIYDFDDDILF